MRSALNCRVLSWIDDYLVVPGIGLRESTPEECQELSQILDLLFPRLDLLRHPDKGVWGRGTTRIEHLGLFIDTDQFRFYVSQAKLSALHEMAQSILQLAANSKRWVSERLLRSFAGKAISQTIPIPLARFFTRGIFEDLKLINRRHGRFPDQKVRLSNAGLRDVKAWSTMIVGDGRLIYGGHEAWLQTEASAIGYGGTLGTDMRAGSDGEVHVQEVWSPFLRLRSITFRELVAVRKTLEKDLVMARLRGYHGIIRLHVDNMVVYHI